MPQSLRLWVVSCSCSCGQKWTHSYVTFSLGGTPNAQEEDKLPVEAITETRRNFSHCFRCVPLGLHIGWLEADKSPPAPAIVPSLQHLLDD